MADFFDPFFDNAKDYIAFTLSTSRYPQGFFTPYKDKEDFLLTLVCPFTGCILGSLAATAAAILAGAAAIISMLGFISAPFSCFSKEDSFLNKLTIGAIALGVTILASLVFTACALFAAVSIPIGAARILTRTGTAAVETCTDWMDDCRYRV